MNRIALVALLSSFAAAPAFAENDAGIYAGIKMGSANVGGSAIGYGVFGGYIIDSSVTSNITSQSEFTKTLRFAFELEYTDLGSNSTWQAASTYATYKASAIGVVVAATYPVLPQFSLIAKAGFARTSNELSCSGCPWGWNTSTVDLRGGLAGQYNLTEQIGLQAGIDSYPDGFTQMSAGAVFKF